MVDGFNWQDGDNYQGVSQGTFNLRAMNAEPLSQRGVCSSARSIDELFGGTTGATNYIGPFDDTELVTGLGVNYEADMIGTECWGDATDDGSVWFSFVGDGQSYYLGMDQCQANNQTFVYYFGWDNQLALYKELTVGNWSPLHAQKTTTLMKMIFGLKSGSTARKESNTTSGTMGITTTLESMNGLPKELSACLQPAARP